MWCHLVTRMHSDEQGVKTLCINQLSWTINYVHPPLLCPETNVSWRAQVCFLLPSSAVAHDDVCKSHKHLSYMAREEMRRQTLAKKQALVALFFWLLLSCFLLWFLVEPVFNHMHSLTKGRQGLNVNEVMKRLQEVEGLQTSLISNPPIHQQRIF